MLPNYTNVRIDPPHMQLVEGASYVLQSTAYDQSGDPVGPEALQWTTSDPAVVVVSPLGRLTAIGPGSAVVRAQLGPASDASAVDVLPRTTPTVTQVTLAPANASLLVGEARQFAATPRDAAGTPVPGLAVAWRTDDPAVATVSGDGVVTAVAEGTTQVVATVAGVSGTAPIVVSPATPPSGDWPHEPAGLTRISDQPWDALSLTGWILQFGTALIGLDPAAPRSPPNVLTIIYPIGFVGGSAPGTEMLPLPMLHQVFVGTWWKVSDPWQGHPSNSNKVQYLFSNGDGSMAMIMYGHPGGPYEMRVFPDWHGAWLTPNVANIPVTLGQWHQIEWLVEYGPTQDPPSGRVRWWMDGQLLGDWSNVRLSSLPLAAYKVAPVWGGAEPELKTEIDYYWYDHTYISGR